MHVIATITFCITDLFCSNRPTDAVDCLQAEDPNKIGGTAAATGTEDNVSVEQSTQIDEDADADDHIGPDDIPREPVVFPKTKIAKRRINFLLLLTLFYPSFCLSR